MRVTGTACPRSIPGPRPIHLQTRPPFTLVIPVLNPGAFAASQVEALARQSWQPDEVRVVDSESTDGSVDAYRRLGAEVVTIARREFRHGRTRALAAGAARHDLVVFLTQDAIPRPDAFERLLTRLLEDPRAGAAYGRQLPHGDASPAAAHVRAFNYPDASYVRRAEDIARLGLRAAFCSNSFAAYRRQALVAVGNFPAEVILAEDMCAAALMLEAGWHVHYAADAAVAHSHNFTVGQEFGLLFDTGVAHAQMPWLLERFGRPTSEGFRFALSEWRALRRGGQPLVAASVETLVRNAARWGGYTLGRRHARLPSRVRTRLSMHKGFWSTTETGDGATRP